MAVASDSTLAPALQGQRPRRPSTSAQDARRLAFARRRLCDHIERLIALLDALDGDPEAEPSLGSIERQWSALISPDRDWTTSQLGWAGGGRDDREDDLDSHEGDGEPEPTVRVVQRRQELRRAA